MDDTHCESEVEGGEQNWITKGRSSQDEGGSSDDRKGSDNKSDPGGSSPPQQRTFDEELSFLEKVSSTRYRVKKGFVPNMKVEGEVLVNEDLEELLLEELKQSCGCQRDGTFLPALKQIANVASLPGIVHSSIAMPDVHSGYGFCIGNVAAFDMEDPQAIISPGGVGFDINCGVRLIRTNLMEYPDVPPHSSRRQELVQALFDHIPVGVGTQSIIPITPQDLDDILFMGMDWALREGYAWPEDKENCEENGRMTTADPSEVSARAKKRGLLQLGTLGGGNHYAEIQVIDEIYDAVAASRMGLRQVGQVCLMVHSGSRGLGHQVATDALVAMDRIAAAASTSSKIPLNDRQLSAARISSPEGQVYLKAMSAAANYAWVNRSCMTYLARRAFTKVFEKASPEELDMHVVYDVSHNIAKVETHMLPSNDKDDKGENKNDDASKKNHKPQQKQARKLLVHRKGCTRAFPPHHPSIPLDYQLTGQPVLIGGSMGTCSYVLVGTTQGMQETFGSTCHGAGRALSRNASRKRLDYQQVLQDLQKRGIEIRVASPKLVTEEAPESYKDVTQVVDTCEEAGISRKVVKLRPIGVVKG